MPSWKHAPATTFASTWSNSSVFAPAAGQQQVREARCDFNLSLAVWQGAPAGIDIGAFSVAGAWLNTEPRLNHTHAEVLYVIVPNAIEQSAELLGFLVEEVGIGCVMAPCYETQIFELWSDSHP